jgi:hypothetical protein
MSTLHDQANATARQALRACHDYVVSHDGERSAILDETYTAAERVVDSIEEFERLEALAHDGAEDAWEATLSTGQYQAAPLADRGDHFAGMR